MFKDKNGQELSFNEALPKIKNRIVSIGLDFELMLLRWVGFIPSHTFRQLIYRSTGVQIGKGTSIHMWANFYNPDNIEIGKDTIIGDHCFLDGRAKIKIGNHVDIASQVLIYNSEHDVHDPQFKAIEQPVVIEDYVFIGPRVTILPGVKINKGAVVAAGAIVTKDIPAGKIFAGVPAKEIGERRVKEFNYYLGRPRLFQ